MMTTQSFSYGSLFQMVSFFPESALTAVSVGTKVAGFVLLCITVSIGYGGREGRAVDAKLVTLYFALSAGVVMSSLASVLAILYSPAGHRAMAEKDSRESSSRGTQPLIAADTARKEEMGGREEDGVRKKRLSEEGQEEDGEEEGGVGEEEAEGADKFTLWEALSVVPTVATALTLTQLSAAMIFSLLTFVRSVHGQSLAQMAFFVNMISEFIGRAIPYALPASVTRICFSQASLLGAAVLRLFLTAAFLVHLHSRLTNSDAEVLIFISVMALHCGLMGTAAYVEANTAVRDDNIRTRVAAALNICYWGGLIIGISTDAALLNLTTYLQPHAGNSTH